MIGWFTSLVMQPSLLISYRLKAQLSLSVMVPLRMMDRLITKSYSRERKQALKVKTTIKTKKAQTKLCSICCIDTMFCFFSSNPVLLTPTEFHQQSEIILKSNEIYTRCAPRTKLYAAFFQTLRKSIIKLHSIDKEKDSKEDEKGKGKTSLWAAGNERRLWGVYLTSKLTEPLFCVSKASNKKCAYILESAKENIRKQVTVTVQQSRRWFCVMTA